MADGSVPSIVRRRDALHVRAVREDSREVDFIASTDAIDSYDEIVDQASWDLTRFEKNPVILYQHDRWSLPIGQATRCEVVNNQLECTIKFASAEANPEAEKVWKLVLEKVLRAVSVGFKPYDGKYEMRDGRDVYVLYKNELREISIVTVPANEDCLAQMKAASLTALGIGACVAGAEAEFVRDSKSPEMRERIRSAIANQPKAAKAAPSPSTNDSPTKGDTERNMTAEEIKAIQEKADKAEKALVDARVAEKSASDKMAAADARIKAVETERDTLATANATLTKEHAKAAEDRDAATARATKAEADLIKLEVDGLVGKKIAPTEVEDFIKLRTDSPELFASMIAKRADMKMGETVIKADVNGKGAPLSANVADAGGSLWNKL
jgi:HK97 family phage prohead protease